MEPERIHGTCNDAKSCPALFPIELPAEVFGHAG
jgi:hypothetical protein